MSLSEVTELRIHGVSGTPPESILQRPHVRQVAGDGSAGFYRPSDGGSPTHGPAGPRMEAYSWGNLTSGASARALWLLLLPFMLVNLASWMRPRRARPGDPRRVKLGETMVFGICRMLALTLTATVVLTAVGLAMDLVAWQCAAPGRSCGDRRSYLHFLGTGFFSEPGRRLAVGALVPVLTIVFLWFLGRRTWQRYECVKAGAGAGYSLDDPGFWYGRHLVGRLRTLHFTFGLATVVIALTGPVLAHDRAVASGRAGFGYGLLAVGALLILATAASVWVPVVIRRDIKGRALYIKPMRLISLLLVPVAFAYAMLPRPDWVSKGALPGFAPGVIRLFGVQMALLLLLTAAVWLLRGRRLPYPAALGGFATPLVAGLALFLQTAFTAGLSFRLSDWLDRGAVPNSASETASSALEPPVPYAWAGLGFFLACVLVLVVAVLTMFWLMPRLVARAAARARSQYHLKPGQDDDRVADIAKVVGAASLTDRGGMLLAAVMIPAVIGALVVTALVLIVGGAPVELVDPGTRTAVALSVMTNAGAYLVGAFALALVVLGRMAYKTVKTRRLVGIAWDIGTFWPRDAHPLAPPCYAERSVPDLVTRTSWLADGTPERSGVVLAGHSQGSVLAAATVLQLSPDTLQRLALLTYGSPLSRLYGNYFPAFFSAAELREVRDRVTTADHPPPRWTNLYVDGDPIGGPVLPEIDRRLLPVLSFDRPAGDTADPPVLGHSDYPLTPEFDETVDKLAISVALTPSIDLRSTQGGASPSLSSDKGHPAEH
ncbi:MAG: hypothetical protein WCB04_00415 [Mycobacteriales bacterium]